MKGGGRRANGEGSEPRLRGDGRWQATYTGADGLRHAVTMPKGSTKQACRDAVRAAIRATEDGHAPADRRLTVGKWLDIWLADHVAGGTRPKRPSTVASYTLIVEKHLRPRLGRVVLSGLTPGQVEAALGDMRASGLAASTTVHVFHVLRIALNEAVRVGRLRANPCARVRAPEVRHTAISPWDAEEINRFLDKAAGLRYGPLFQTAIATGLRKGELLGLRWADVDFERGTLRVERQRLRTGAFGPTKSDAGVRTIGLNALAVEALRAQKERQAEDSPRAGSRWANPEELVFTTSRGTSPTAWALWCAFADATTKAGVRPIRIHDLRHACATLLLTAGEELAVISKVLGHADYSTTLKVYAHLDPKRAKAAAGRIDAALGRQPVAAEVAAV